VVDKMALGQVFSEYFGFPCQFSFHQLLHNHPHLSFGAVQYARSGRSTWWRKSHPTKKNSKITCHMTIILRNTHTYYSRFPTSSEGCVVVLTQFNLNTWHFHFTSNPSQKFVVVVVTGLQAQPLNCMWKHWLRQKQNWIQNVIYYN
jgi:hypothetical protein